MRLPKSLALLLLSVGLLVGGVIAWRRHTASPTPPPRTVRSPDPLPVIHEVGVLEPRLIQRIHSPLDGTLAAVIDDGVRVQKGDLLFRLDEEEIRSGIEDQEDDIELKLEELETAQSELQVLTTTYPAISKREQAELQHAELELAHRESGLTPEEQRLHEIRIALAELDLQDRRERLTRQQELIEREFAATSSLDTFQREVEAAEAFLHEQRTQFQLENQPLPEEERLTLQAAVDQARDVVERSERRHAREVDAKKLEIESIQLELKHQRETLAERKQELEEIRIHSPEDGIVRIMRRMQWRTRSWQPLSVGQQTWNLDVLGDLVDPSNLSLRVLIHESDILRVQPGQPVSVRLNAFPDRELPGSVLSVTQLGQDRMDLTPVYRQSPPTQQAQFLAEIDVNIGDLPAMPGMTAVVRIHLGEDQP